MFDQETDIEYERKKRRLYLLIIFLLILLVLKILFCVFLCGRRRFSEADERGGGKILAEKTAGGRYYRAQ